MMRFLQSLILTLFYFQYANSAQSSISEIYLGSREGDPSSIVENVSIIHGDYTELEVDLVVNAPDPLIVSRYYSSRDSLQIASFGGWRFNPHCYLTKQKDPKNKTYSTGEEKYERTLVHVGNSDGSILTYVGWENITDFSKKTLFKIDPSSEAAGLTNTAKGNINCWTNQKNNELYFDPQNDRFELHLCSEGKCFYAKHPIIDGYFITHEILPSGNKVFYEFNENGQLILIKEYNATEKKVLAWITFLHDNGVHIETSDGKTASYEFEQDPSGTYLLTNVHRSDKPQLHYQYQIVDNHALMLRKTLPEERFVEIDYYTGKINKNKVRSVTAPISSSTTTSTQFSYEDGHTEVNGPGTRKAVYQYDENLQLATIEDYLDGNLYRVNKKSWGIKSNAGNLISSSIEDALGNVFYYKYFIYDRTGNIIEEREYGDLTGTGTVILIIDDDGLVTNQDGHRKNYSYFSGNKTHGFFQTDVKGTGVKYWYKKGTNLLIKKFILTKGSLDKEDENYDSGIKQRNFYTYNEDAVLIQEITDDGRGIESKDTDGVSQRTIINISPKQTLPNIGVPEIIEQKYISPNRKLEFLLNKTINQFDNHGNIVSQSIYDANEEYQYSIFKEYENGLLVLETDALGNETRYSYDPNRNLITKTHSDTGISIEYGYDLRNRFINIIEKNQSGNRFQTEISYDQRGFKISETDRFGNETIYVNDDLGRLLSIKYPEISDGPNSRIRPTYTYTYDLFDNPISVTDPKGRVLSNSYTVKGQPAKINHLDGTKDLFVYDSGGNLYQHHDRNGLLQVFEYDYLGRLNRLRSFKRGTNGSKDPFKEKYYSYNSFHKTYEVDERGNQTTYTYDGAGRPVSYKKGNQKVEFIYDSLGRVHGTKKWKSSNTFTLEVKEYDLLNRVVEERIEDTNGRILVKKRYVYNDTAQLTQVIGYPQNKESILMQYEYDGFGRLNLIRNAAGQATKISYDEIYVTDLGQKGKKCTLIDPSGNQTEETFDHDGNLIKVSKKDQSGQVLSSFEISYDSSGNKILERALVMPGEDQSMIYETDWSFNQADQLESFTMGKGTTNECISRFVYNSFGELAARYIPGSQEPITYQYDLFGNLGIVTYQEDKKEIKYRLSYDSRKNLIGMTCDSYYSLTSTYDANDLPQVETIKDQFGSYQVSLTYDGEGKIQNLQFPDGSFVAYTYEGPFVKSACRFSKDKKELYNYQVSSRDQMGNILKEILPGSLGIRNQFWDRAGRRTEISTDFFKDKVLQEGYDPLQNITKRQITLDEETYTADYGYNRLGQLITEKGEIDHKYSYDSIGNRLQKDDSSYKVNGLNQIIEAEGTSYSFHPNGTLATKTTGNRTWTYKTNPLNQIVSIKDTSENTVTFTYDLTGKRLSKRVESKDKKSKIFRFFYLGETEIGCVDESGAIIELKIPCNPNNPEAPCIAIEIKKEAYVPIYDLQGNIACLLDHQRREIVESYRYSVYGEEEITNARGRVVSDSSIGNPWRYRGKRVDKEVKLIYFGYRYYDPELGRWISPDPAGTLDGPNLYAFVHNNPMTYVDYFGLSSTIEENCGCTQHDHPGWHNAPPGCVCICGKNGSFERGPSVSQRNRGSDIQNAIYSMGPNFAAVGIVDLLQIRSGPYEVGSIDLLNGGIGFINGINNTLDAAKAHTLRISQYANGSKVQGIYNATKTTPVDVFECILGHAGMHTPPVEMLKKQWKKFIDTHGPNAKFLQICHSGGAIHVLNALISSPKEIRDRIIVLAISPGAIVPKELCYESYNYASKRDIVPWLAAVMDGQYKDQITKLDPHNDADIWDHGFDSPTFEDQLQRRITNYLSQYGK